MKNDYWHKLGLSIAAVLAISFTSPVFALGLGNAEVRSYLNQPLLLRIPLITRSDEELGTITAGFASAADIEMMGLSRAVSVPLHFEVINDADSAYVQVSSRLAITDPILQLVLQVQWSGGRMLREYTMFLDPPTFASKAPAPVVSPAPPPVQEQYPDPSELDVVETIKQPATRQAEVEPARERVEIPAIADAPAAQDEQPATKQVRAASPEPAVIDSRQAPEPLDEEAEQLESEAGEISEPENLTLESNTIPGPPDEPVTPADEVFSEPVSAEPTEQAPAVENIDIPQVGDESEEISDQEAAEPDVLAVEDLATIEPAQETNVTTETSAEDSTGADTDEAQSPNFAKEPDFVAQFSDQVHGPVQRGETLWTIASRYNSGTSYSINQAMLAIQRLNPDAFGGRNINSLRQGAVLRMPTFEEVGRLTKRDAMLEAMRQEEAYIAMREGGRSFEDLPAVAEFSAPELADEPQQLAAESGDEDGQGILQLVPPSESGDQSVGGNGSGDAAVGAVSGSELEEVLARTEEELANAQQENAYLNDRIRELEAQVAATQDNAGVSDSAMAELEQGLREDRLSEEAETAPAEEPESESWYRSSAWFLAGGILVLVALVVWLLRKLGGNKPSGPGDESVDTTATVEDIRTDAEDILKALDENDTPEVGKVIDLENYVEPAERVDEPVSSGEKAKVIPMDDEHAVELDSEDPEVQLDLARAYLSMGDSDSAREMLETVLESGNEDQVREAKDMMEEL